MNDGNTHMTSPVAANGEKMSTARRTRKLIRTLNKGKGTDSLREGVPSADAWAKCVMRLRFKLIRVSGVVASAREIESNVSPPCTVYCINSTKHSTCAYNTSRIISRPVGMSTVKLLHEASTCATGSASCAIAEFARSYLVSESIQASRLGRCVRGIPPIQ